MSSAGRTEGSEGGGVYSPSSPKVRGLLLSLLLPDVSFSFAIITFIYCLFVFDGAQKLFRDSDTGWHIRTGEVIWTGKGLPRVDPYSFSRSGEQWFVWEWGADALMGCAHLRYGLPGVVVLFSLAVSASTWLWFRLHWAAGGDFLLACAMCPLMISTATLHWLARPHVLSWLLLLVAVISVEKYPGGLRGWHIAAAAGMGSLWANIHGSFFFAPLVGVLYALGTWLATLIWANPKTNTRQKSLWLLALSAAAAIGSLANPYGWRLHMHIARYLTNRELLARVGEFQSFNFHVAGAGQIVAMFVICATGIAAMFQRRRIDHALLGLLLLVGALRSARTLPLLALLAMPLANGAFTEAFRKGEGLAPHLNAWRERFFNYSAGLRRLDRGLAGWVWVPVGLVLALLLARSPWLATRAGFPPDEFPVSAAAAVEGLPGTARILAPDKFGGYLIYRFAGQRKVFMDGRSDFYGVNFMKSYILLMEARPGWRKLAGEYRFTHALLPVNSSLLDALEHEGWRRLYADRTAVLLERPEE